MRRTRFTVRVPSNDSRIFLNSWYPKLTAEMLAWLEEYGYKPKYQSYGSHVVFAFKTQQEALMFSLRWL